MPSSWDSTTHMRETSGPLSRFTTGRLTLLLLQRSGSACTDCAIFTTCCLRHFGVHVEECMAPHAPQRGVHVDQCMCVRVSVRMRMCVQGSVCVCVLGRWWQWVTITCNPCNQLQRRMCAEAFVLFIGEPFFWRLTLLVTVSPRPSSLQK